MQHVTELKIYEPPTLEVLSVDQTKAGVSGGAGVGVGVGIGGSLGLGS